jgi:hypothetical protein
MSCCADQQFERHPDPEMADIGSGGGAELTVGRCTSCGALLVHCWVGGVAGGIQVVSRDLIDHFRSVEPSSRKTLIGDWFNSLA